MFLLVAIPPFGLPPLSGVVAAPGRAILSVVIWAAVVLVVGTLVRLAIARREGQRTTTRIVKRVPRSGRDAA